MGILVFLTLILAVVSIYITYTLTNQNQAPTDTSASVLCSAYDSFEACTTVGEIRCNNGNEQRCTRFFCHATDPNQTANENRVRWNNTGNTCTGSSVCGNGQCETGETNSSCSQDCPSTGQQCTPLAGCLVFICPNGCGTDGRCQTGGSEADEGATVVVDPSCSGSIGGNGCGQVDIMTGSSNDILGGTFCAVQSNTCSQVQCQAQCNDICTGVGTQGTCSSGLTCTDVGNGVNRCRVATNPTSETCQQITTGPQCNDVCTGAGTQGNCPSGLICTQLTGSESGAYCRNPLNPSSATCEPPTQQQTRQISLNGNVYCQDGNGPVYQIPGAVVTANLPGQGQFYEQTNSTGGFQFDRQNLTTTSMLLQNLSVSLPNGTLSTGQSIAALVGPNATNCSTGTQTGCTGGTGNYCSTGSDQYQSCTLNAPQLINLYQNFNFRFTNCSPQPNQCIDVLEGGEDPIDAGVGNTVNYTLQYRFNQSTNPFPNIRLRVGPSGTPVGRDFYVPANVLVAPASIANNPSYNPSTGIWTYIFTWESAEVGGADVADGTYDVRVLTDGTGASEITTPVGCLETLTITNGTTQQPNFQVVKQAASVCQSDGAAAIDYTITVTNIGPVSGAIDFVEDTIDSTAVALGLVPTNITPSFGTFSNGRITWIGTVGDRTYTAGQSKNFTYRLTVPRNNLISFLNGVDNQVEVEFTTTSTNTRVFSLTTMLVCSLPPIPMTGIGDEGGRYLLIGGMLFIIALLIFKFRIGAGFVDKLMSEGLELTEEKITSSMPYEKGIEKRLKRKANR